MTPEGFQENMARLRQEFGAKHFSSERETMIMRGLRSMTDETFAELVAHLISTFRVAPLPKDIFEASREFKSKKTWWALGEIRPQEIAQCQDCGDSGFIRLERKPVYETWAKWQCGSAPCHCPRGKQLIDAAARRKVPMDLGPQFNDRWRKSYTVMPAYKGKSTFLLRPSGDEPDGAA